MGKGTQEDEAAEQGLEAARTVVADHLGTRVLIDLIWCYLPKTYCQRCGIWLHHENDAGFLVAAPEIKTEEIKETCIQQKPIDFTVKSDLTVRGLLCHHFQEQENKEEEEKTEVATQDPPPEEKPEEVCAFGMRINQCYGFRSMCITCSDKQALFVQQVHPISEQNGWGRRCAERIL